MMKNENFTKDREYREYLLFSKKSLIDSCEAENASDSGSDSDSDEDDTKFYLNDGGDDDEEEEEDDSYDDEYEYDRQDEPCKVRSFDIRLGGLYNDMGQAVEDAVTSFGSSSKCTAETPVHNNKSEPPLKQKLSCSGQEPPKLNVFKDKTSRFLKNLRSSWDGNNFSLRHTPSCTGNNNTTTRMQEKVFPKDSWDDKDDQKTTFSNFMRNAKEDLKNFYSLDDANDADTATTVPTQTDSNESIPSNDEASLILNLQTTNSNDDQSICTLLQAMPDQSGELGVAKDIGQGFLLRTRSNPIVAAIDNRKKTIRRSTSYETANLEKVAVAMNRKKHGSMLPPSPASTTTTANFAQSLNLNNSLSCISEEEDESSDDIHDTNSRDREIISQGEIVYIDLNENTDEVHERTENRADLVNKRVTFVPPKNISFKMISPQEETDSLLVNKEKESIPTRKKGRTHGQLETFVKNIQSRLKGTSNIHKVRRLYMPFRKKIKQDKKSLSKSTTIGIEPLQCAPPKRAQIPEELLEADEAERCIILDEAHKAETNDFLDALVEEINKKGLFDHTSIISAQDCVEVSSCIMTEPGCT